MTVTPTFPPPPTPRPGRRRWPAVLGVVLAVLGAAAGVHVARSGNEPEGPGFPGAWDARVRDLVEFVAAERGLAFRHPVFIDFLPETEFVATVTGEDSQLTDDEKREITDFESLARALGLPTGESGLLDAVNTMSSVGILAYYSHDRQRVTVRGTDLTVARKVTLVHELTHALQDQHFDLSRAESLANDAQQFAFDAIVEGDATRIEDAYLDTLSGDERRAYDEETFGADAEESLGALEHIPAWLTGYFTAPYVLGDGFVNAVLDRDGRRALDDLFRSPPRSEEQIYDLTKFLDGNRPQEVPSPKLAAGDREIDRADFGSFGLMFMLGERLPAAEAVTAVEDWDGDAYVAFDRGGVVCAEITMVGDGPAATHRLAGTLERWAAAMPAGAATVTRTGSRIEILSCDPGPAAAVDPAPKGALGDVMTLIVFKAEGILMALETGLDTDRAACLGNEAVRRFTPEEIRSGADIPDVEERWAAVARACSSPAGGEGRPVVS